MRLKSFLVKYEKYGTLSIYYLAKIQSTAVKTYTSENATGFSLALVTLLQKFEKNFQVATLSFKLSSKSLEFPTP